MSTGDAPAPGVILCVGAERWLRQQAVEDLKRESVAAGFEEADFVRFSDPKTEPRAILEAVRTAPFGSPRRLVLVDGLEELTPDSVPWLKELLDRPNPKCCVVLCADRSRLPRSGQTRVISCLPLEGQALEEWVARCSERKGKPIEKAAAAELIRRAGPGLQGLDLALESLALMAGGAVVTRLDVETLVAPSLRQTAFEILDAAASGRVEEAARALREATALNRIGMDQFLGAVGWYLRMGWKASRGGGFSRLQRWPPARFQEMLEELLRSDVRIKQGHPSPEWLADRLLMKLR